MTGDKYHVIAWLHFSKPDSHGVYSDMADFICEDGAEEKLSSQIFDGVQAQAKKFIARMKVRGLCLTHTDTVLCERIEEEKAQ